MDLDLPDPTGHTARQQLEAIHKSTGILPERLKNEPKLPAEFEYIHALFWEIKNFCTALDVPISLIDIKTYQELYEVRFHPLEVDIIHKLDMRLVSIATKKKAEME